MESREFFQQLEDAMQTGSVDLIDAVTQTGVPWEEAREHAQEHIVRWYSGPNAEGQYDSLPGCIGLSECGHDWREVERQLRKHNCLDQWLVDGAVGRSTNIIVSSGEDGP